LHTALARTVNLSDWYSVDFSTLRDEIRAGRPVAARVAWRDEGAHFVVIDGFVDDEAETIAVSDPSPAIPSSSLPLSQFATAYALVGTCTHIYETRP
jgi:hypothetical protein